MEILFSFFLLLLFDQESRDNSKSSLPATFIAGEVFLKKSGGEEINTKRCEVVFIALERVNVQRQTLFLQKEGFLCADNPLEVKHLSNLLQFGALMNNRLQILLPPHFPPNQFSNCSAGLSPRLALFSALKGFSPDRCWHYPSFGSNSSSSFRHLFPASPLQPFISETKPCQIHFRKRLQRFDH